MKVESERSSLPSRSSKLFAGYVRIHARRFTAITAITLLYWQARIPGPPNSLLDSSRRFAFHRYPLFSQFAASLSPGVGVHTEDVDGHRYFVRDVHPSFYHIRSWI